MRYPIHASMRQTGRWRIALAAILLAAPTASLAAVVSGSLQFTAVFFNAGNGSVANGASVAVAVADLGLPGSWTPALTSLKNAVINGVLFNDVTSIGHALNGTQTLPGTDDWRLALNTVSVVPAFREFTYALSRVPSLQFQTFTGSVSVVPEPDTALLALCGASAGLLLCLLRR